MPFTVTILSDPSQEKDLLALVKRGDVQQVREFFDRAFWEGRPVRPGWPHLEEALLQQNKPMVRLLVTWGATTTSEELSVLRYSNVYEQSVRLLRRCGLDVYVTPGEEEESKGDAALPGKFKCPREWQQLLEAFQKSGAKEAVIAGGAMRDLLNGKPVKDVDIFLKTRGDQKKNKNFLKKAFQAAGLKIGWQGDDPEHLEQFPGPVWEHLSHNDPYREPQYARAFVDTPVESWKVIAGQRETEYNIVFVGGQMSRWVHAHVFHDVLIRAFDFGLCQVAFNGADVISTHAYKEDVKNKSVTLKNVNAAVQAHLWRIMKKYPDWKPCAESKKLLPPSTAPTSRRSGSAGPH
jgi:hypothetical protein